jgi:hippurate hydrolase
MSRQVIPAAACALTFFSVGLASVPHAADVNAEVNAQYPRAESLYLDLHRHPELSFHETQTAAKLANELKQLGFEVTTGVGRTGIVGILKNGAGPTVMLRTELDALPVTEATGLPFASTVRTKDDAGNDVGVMHACGHDVHMSAWMGTARIMAASKNTWRGTLMVLGQPAEETVAGARAMIADGLFTRFPKPNFVIAVHDDARLPAGLIGYHAGPILTNADALTIKIYGRGGHGARPDATVDPIVIAARTVLSLQTIVSRENSPFDPAVVTVGSIHGGTKNNIIPDEVQLQLTVRSFTDPVRIRLVAAIERITKAEAMAAGAPKEPTIEYGPPTNALVNDSALTRRVSAVLLKELGASRVKDAPPEMASEDLAEFQLAGIPTLMMRIGAVEQAKYDASTRGGPSLPSLHSSQYAPDREPTIKSAMIAEVLALRELMSIAR